MEKNNKEYIFDNGRMICSFDLEFNIIFANNKFYEVSGYEKSEIIGKKCDLLIHQDIPKSTLSNIYHKVKKGSISNEVLKYIKKDGECYWAYTTIVPIVQNGKTIGYSSIQRPAYAREIEEAKYYYNSIFSRETA